MTLGKQEAIASSQPGAPRGVAAEFGFLIDFCRPRRTHTAAPGLDWEIIGRGLDRHGLSRLIPEMVATPGLVPAAAAEQLRALQREQAAAALAQIGETVRLCALLDQAEVRFLLIKGLALSVQLYGQPGLRASKDIDLLVEPGAGPRVDAVLSAIGYARPEEDLAKDDLPGYVPKEVGYLNHARGMMVEVHVRLTENDDLYATDFEDLWASRETVTVGGRPLPTMARERLATYLCVHGARHCWARLMWLLDIAPLTRTPAEIDAALADARRHRLEPVMLHALWMLHAWFEHDVPAEVLARARTSRAVRILNRLVAIFHAGPHWYAAPGRRSWRRFFQYSVLGRIASYSMKPERGYWRQQLAFDLISPADRTLVALPARLDWGYAAIRPFGWLIRRLRS